MYRKAHINITLDGHVLSWIDTLRGQDPRSTFINKILAVFCTKSRNVFDWEEENRKAEEDIRHGRVHKFQTPQAAIQWLKKV